VDHAALASFLDCLPELKGQAWIIVTSPTGRDFLPFIAANAQTLIEKWPQGRAFCAKLELRWRRLPGAQANDVVVLTESQDVRTRAVQQQFQPIGGDWQTYSPGNQAFRAWGSPDPLALAVRLETRLPGPVQYPSVTGDLSQLRLECLYYLDASGAVRFARLTRVAGVE
jgi:hypothetical protein